MNKILATGLAGMMCAAGFTVHAQSNDMKKSEPAKEATLKQQGMPMSRDNDTKAPMSHRDGMKMMDSNSDGMVSKDEFMKHHEAMYDKMKKGPNGMVSLKDMEAMPDHPAMKK